MKILIIVNDAPYGTERMYNALPGLQVLSLNVTGSKSNIAKRLPARIKARRCRRATITYRQC
jgi:hypothetical protein